VINIRYKDIKVFLLYNYFLFFFIFFFHPQITRDYEIVFDPCNTEPIRIFGSNIIPPVPGWKFIHQIFFRLFLGQTLFHQFRDGNLSTKFSFAFFWVKHYSDPSGMEFLPTKFSFAFFWVKHYSPKDYCPVKFIHKKNLTISDEVSLFVGQKKNRVQSFLMSTLI
jgi:hypothetical protein